MEKGSGSDSNDYSLSNPGNMGDSLQGNMGQTFSSRFAKVLQRVRVKMGLSQEDLAHRAGLHRTYVGLIERGRRRPTIEVGHALAVALRVPLSWLIREAEMSE